MRPSAGSLGPSEFSAWWTNFSIAAAQAWAARREAAAAGRRQLNERSHLHLDQAEVQPALLFVYDLQDVSAGDRWIYSSRIDVILIAIIYSRNTAQ
jgi:hypothetical protein